MTKKECVNCFKIKWVFTSGRWVNECKACRDKILRLEKAMNREIEFRRRMVK